MSRFLTEFDVRLVDDDSLWELREDLLYESDMIRKVIRIPKGFQCDGASIPRIPIVFMFYGDRAHREGFLHDAMYRIDSIPCVSKELADELFLEAMTARKKPFYVRYPLYWGVRIGGSPFYHKRKMMDRL